MSIPVVLLSLLLVGAARFSASQTIPHRHPTSKFRQWPNGFRSADTNVENAEATTPPWLQKPDPRLSDQLMPRKRPAAAPAVGDAQRRTPWSAADQPKRYIVQLKTPSAAGSLQPVGTNTAKAPPPHSDGSGADGFRSIRPGRITPRAAAASSAVLSEVQVVAAAAGLNDAQISHRYSYALSGFAVQNPTAAQLKALAADPQVLSVVEDKRVRLATYSTPHFLGLTGKGVRTSSVTTSQPQYYGGDNGGHHHSANWGLWDDLGGVLGKDGAGENVLIGVIDTGIWMPNITSFADSNYWSTSSSKKRQRYSPLDDFKGACDVTEGPAECNNKVVGCRYYTAGLGGDEAVKDLYPYESLSCKDIEGHGSHVSGIAAGNYGTSSSEAPRGALLSGMAPRARIAAYKVFWGRGGTATYSDVISAIEDAIKDGVDILNLSLGSEAYSIRRPFDVALMNAARAGVFVATAGGNDESAPVINLSPWYTTVAASTHDREEGSTLLLGDGTSLIGASGVQDTAVGPLPLLLAEDLAAGSGFFQTLGLCFPGSLDASKVLGPAIIVCNQGLDLGVYFDTQAAEVMRVGGKAMVVLNNQHFNRLVPSVSTGIPYVQLGHTAVLAEHRDALLQYARKTGASATVGALTVKRSVTAPAMAWFSSRGPAPAGGGVVMKPDITAPGVNVFSAYTGGDFIYASGTSMSTPHIAGIAALIKDKYPSWSPMMIKSAIMTTAYQTTRTGTKGQPFGTALDYGAGHVDPAAAMNPGLVFDTDFTDWQRFLCDVEPLEGDDCTQLCAASTTTSTAGSVEHTLEAAEDPALTISGAGGQGGAQLQSPHHKDTPRGGSAANPCSALNINFPWVSAEEVFGVLTVQRTLMSVLPHSHGKVTFTATGSADPGSSIDVQISPKRFDIGTGEYGKQQQAVTITITSKRNTPSSVRQFGQVVWHSNKGHVVRIPVVLSFISFRAPEFIYPEELKPEFTYTYKVNAGAATSISVKNSGFSAGTVTPVEVWKSAYDPTGAYPEDRYPGVGKLNITVPPGNTYFGVSIFSSDVEEGVDIDLVLKRGDEVLDGSVGFYASETIRYSTGLPAGEYTLLVPYLDYRPGAERATVYVHTWLFPSSVATSSGTMEVSPSSVLARPDDKSCCPITLSFSNLDFTSTPPKRYIGLVDYTRADGVEPTVPRTIIYMRPGY